jgi:hypothetical protein
MNMATGHKPLGQWLLDEHVLDAGALQDALVEQRVLGGRLGDRLIASGRCRSRDVFRCLALQHNLPFVSLTAVPPDTEALKLLPEADARTLGVVPVRVRYAGDGLRLTVAVGSPEGRRLAAAVERRTGARVDVTVADPHEIQEAFAGYRRLGGALGTPLMRGERDDVPAPVDLHEEPDFIGTEPARSETRIRQAVDADLEGAGVEEGPMFLTDEDVAILEEGLEAVDNTDDAEEVAMRTELTPSSAIAAALAPLPVAAAVPVELQRMGQVHFDPPDVVALRARVMKLETQVSDLAAAAEGAQALHNRINILEALVEQLLRARQAAVVEPAVHTPSMVDVALGENLATPPDGVAAREGGQPASWGDAAGVALEARALPPPLPEREDQSGGNSTEEVLALLDEPGPVTLDALDPEIPTNPETDPPPLPRRKGNPFAALLAEAEASGVRPVPTAQELDGVSTELAS